MISVVFVEPEESENIGLLARVMKNFGLKKLCLVNPRCDLDRAYIVSKHALDVVNSSKIMEDFGEVRSEFDLLIATTAKVTTEWNVDRSFLTPEQLVKKLREVKEGEKVAIVFGREGNGLSNSELEKCDLIVHIPASGEYPTLNVTHSAAVLFYEIFKGAGKGKSQGKTEGKTELPDEKVKEAIMQHWEKIVTKAGFTGEKKKIKMGILRRVLGKSLMNRREAYGLAGVLRKIERNM